jgi:hypothetical protein
MRTPQSRMNLKSMALHMRHQFSDERGPCDGYSSIMSTI